MKIIKQYVLMIIFISITGFGAALALKAAIGVGPWDALAQSISYVTPLKIGTIGMVLNISCVFGQLIVMREDFKLKMFLQIFVSLLTGTMVNLFYYNVLGSLVLESYGVRLALLLISSPIIAMSVSAIMELDIAVFPLEGLCLALANKFNLRFSHLRQVADVLSVIVIVAMTFLFSIPLTLREGTIISTLIFGPMLAFFMPKMRKLIDYLTP